MSDPEMTTFGMYLEPAPVAWMLTDLDGKPLEDCGDLVVKLRPVLVSDKTDCVPLYTVPPKREWVGLTKEEARKLCVANVPYVVDMVTALEAKLKERNT